ncbi:MAG TPA: DNA primase [Candidatus Limnocylindrales bacterium]|nr:DNA primase [Candidatus Limnocylindrales bacterium]
MGRRLVSGANKERSLSVGATAEVKSKLSVVEVVGESVTLKKAGTTYKGLCPFHGEKTPSFIVTPARETWHCFGCGRGGDIFSFVMERDGLTFPEALRSLAGKAGVEIDERTKREDARRKRLRDVLDAAIAFYHAVLTNSKSGETALAYLKGRGFSDATIETYQLGWAPAGWDHMARQLQAKRGIRPEELIEVGLASPSQRGRGPIDKFRARVLFPIRDQNGHAVGLGGRLLEGDGPKYLNSPATPLFDKSRTLYLIDRAKGPIRRSEQAVIVEGYTDALMAHQAGFDNVVASLGTALTPNQIGLLTRYAKRIALAYDVDPAGEKAGTLGVTALTGLIGQLQADDSGVKLEDVRVVRLPEGKDPDEVIREAPADWEQGVAKAKPLVEYLIDHHASRFDLKQSTGRIGFVEAVIPAIRDVADPLRRDEALQEVRRVSGVDERVLRQVLDRRLAAVGPGRGAAATRITADAVLASPDALPIGDILRAITPVEAELLRLLLLVPDQQIKVANELGPDQLPSTLARELYRAIVLQRAADDHGVHPPSDSAALLLAVDDETASLARALYAKAGPDPRTLEPRQLAYEIARLLLELEDDQLRERSDYNEAAQAEAERDGDTDSIERLLLERRQINEARRSLDRRRDETRLLARPEAAVRV